MRHFHALVGWAICVLGTYCLTQPTFAAESRDDRVTVLEEKLDRSLKLIDQLTVRMRALEAQLANKGTAAAPAQSAVAAESSPQTQTRLENVEEQLAQLTDANAARGGGPGVPLHGFADIG